MKHKIRNNTFQLRCPRCNHEFTYDNGYYDKNIANIAKEIHNIMAQHAEYKTLPSLERVKRKEWYERSKRALILKEKEIRQLKELRKICDQQVNSQMFVIWKVLVKDRFGEDIFNEMLREAEEELKCYQVTGMMRRPYTRSNKKSSVTSINKL